MNIDISIFYLFIAMSFGLIAVGYMARFSIPMSLFVFMAGGLMVALFIMTDNIIINSFATDVVNNSNVFAMDVTSGSSIMTIRTGAAEIRGEYAATSNSALIGKQIDCIDMYLAKTGAPTGLATIGIIDGLVTVEANQLKQSFGTIDVSGLTTNLVPRTFCLPVGTTYTFVQNDVVGAVYRSGDAVNNLNNREDAGNPFDSADSIARRWDDVTQTWLTTGGNDVGVRAYLRANDSIAITEQLAPFSEELKVFMMLMASILLLVGGMIEIQARRS